MFFKKETDHSMNNIYTGGQCTGESLSHEAPFNPSNSPAKLRLNPPPRPHPWLSVRTGVHTLIVWFAPKAVPILLAPAPRVAEEPVYVQNVFPFTTGQDLNITVYR